MNNSPQAVDDLVETVAMPRREDAAPRLPEAPSTSETISYGVYSKVLLHTNLQGDSLSSLDTRAVILLFSSPAASNRASLSSTSALLCYRQNRYCKGNPAAWVTYMVHAMRDAVPA